MSVLGGQFWDIELNSDDELRAVITMLLGMHARAPESMVGIGQSRGGWWGNSYPDIPGVELGSLFWAMRGRPINAQLIEDFRLEVIRALRPLVTYGIAKKIDATAERIDLDKISGQVLVQRPTDLAPQFVTTWETVL